MVCFDTVLYDVEAQAALLHGMQAEVYLGAGPAVINSPVQVLGPSMVLCNLQVILAKDLMPGLGPATIISQQDEAGSVHITDELLGHAQLCDSLMLLDCPVAVPPGHCLDLLQQLKEATNLQTIISARIRCKRRSNL